MNKQVILIVAALAVAAAAQAESYCVVKVVDRADSATFAVLTPAELKTLQSEIQEETRLMPKALALTRKAWEQDANNTKAFPGAAVNRRSAEPIGTPHKDKATATEKAQHLNADALAKAADAVDKSEMKIKKQYSGDKRKEKLAEFRIDDAERKAMEAKVLALYEAQLATLRAPSTAPAPAPAPAPGTAAH